MQKNCAPFFSVLSLAVLFVACGEKKDSVAPVGRIYERNFLGTAFTIHTVGDSADYSKGLDSIEYAYRMHLNLNDPRSTFAQFNEADTSGIEALDKNNLLERLLTQANHWVTQTHGAWDYTISAAQVAWIPYFFDKASPSPNVADLGTYCGASQAGIRFTTLYNQEGAKSIRIKKAKKNARIELTRMGTAMMLDDMLGYLRKHSSSMVQAAIRTADWYVGFGAGSDSLSTIELLSGGVHTENFIRVHNRAFATLDARNKETYISPRTLSPLFNEIYQTYVSAKTLEESVVFTEAFLVMGVQEMGEWYAQNEDSDVQSLVYYVDAADNRTSASTENFDRMFVVKKPAKE